MQEYFRSTLAYFVDERLPSFYTHQSGPKIQAVINFLESGGEQAIITSIEKIKEGLEGKAGTHFFIEEN